jgi:hypothetical protein
VAVVRGADAMRKRQTFKYLVMLDRTGRRAELYVVGPEPGRFLRTSRATAAWALDRAPHARRVFEESFGSLDVPVAQFTERLWPCSGHRPVRRTAARGGSGAGALITRGARPASVMPRKAPRFRTAPRRRAAWSAA